MISPDEIILECTRRRERFLQNHPGVTTALISDPKQFVATLARLKQEASLPGNRFCEWGSGLGQMCALAELQGFEAYGIECEAAFVREAEALCQDCGLHARFAVGSFIPASIAPSFRVIGTYGATDWSIPPQNTDAYQQLGCAVCDMDLIYAYPWPREIPIYQALFDLVAKPGALLWLYVEGGDAVMHCKE